MLGTITTIFKCKKTFEYIDKCENFRDFIKNECLKVNTKSIHNNDNAFACITEDNAIEIHFLPNYIHEVNYIAKYTDSYSIVRSLNYQNEQYVLEDDYNHEKRIFEKYINAFLNSYKTQGR
ncbi:hypothetical protein QTI85_12845 [Clostridium perfringens]|nr:hypothetical protein [Clostridium perfringens]